MILTKFLDLGVFEKMHDIAKSDSSDIRNKIRSQSDGTLYMKTKDITFNGSQEQYKEYKLVIK